MRQKLSRWPRLIAVGLALALAWPSAAWSAVRADALRSVPTGLADDAKQRVAEEIIKGGPAKRAALEDSAVDAAFVKSFLSGQSQTALGEKERKALAAALKFL